MEPKHNNDYLPAVELPPLEQVPVLNVGSEQMPAGPEVRGTSSQPSGAGIATSGSAYGQPSGAGLHDLGGSSQPSGAPIAQTSGLIADDADLIEKEWVLKAKAIVAHTRSDPHLQNIEMTNIKADYLKKRYNKDLKTSGS